MKTYKIEENTYSVLPIEKYKIIRPQDHIKGQPYYQNNKILTIDGVLSTLSAAKYPAEFENKRINSEEKVGGCWADPKHLLSAFSRVGEFKFDTFLVDKTFREQYRAKLHELTASKREDPSIWVGGQAFTPKSRKGFGGVTEIAPIETIIKISTTPQTITKIYVGQQSYKEEITKSCLGSEVVHKVTCFDIVEITNKEGEIILVGIFVPRLAERAGDSFTVDVDPIERGVVVDWQSMIDNIKIF